MPTISGFLLFDRNRTAIPAGLPGIEKVPIVLHSIGTGEQLAVLTGNDGDYTFYNVPNGDYLIVEAYGISGAVLTPGNFNNAVFGFLPRAVTPPISFAPNPPPGSTNLDCLTPNTIRVVIEDNHLTNQNIINAPVRYTPFEPLEDECALASPINLITAADNGSFGFFPAGTPVNTSAPVEPYPGVTPDFEYALTAPGIFVPSGGEYTVQNIMTNTESNIIGAWWRIADHTTGNETGRMMVVNGYDPGAVFFRAQAAVSPNTDYCFSAWILNMFKAEGYAEPAFGVRIRNLSGQVIFSEMLGELIPVNVNVPEWKQIGTVFNSLGYTAVIVEFISEGPEVIGNDYAIDDVSLREIQRIIPIPPSRCQAFTDVIASVALQEAALAHIINAEGEKIQAVAAIPGATAEQLAAVNRSVTRLIRRVAQLENILQAKLSAARDGVRGCLV